jgi:hypothetical protein
MIVNGFGRLTRNVNCGPKPKNVVCKQLEKIATAALHLVEIISEQDAKAARSPEHVPCVKMYWMTSMR